MDYETGVKLVDHEERINDLEIYIRYLIEKGKLPKPNPEDIKKWVKEQEVKDGKES